MSIIEISEFNHYNFTIKTESYTVILSRTHCSSKKNDILTALNSLNKYLSDSINNVLPNNNEILNCINTINLQNTITVIESMYKSNFISLFKNYSKNRLTYYYTSEIPYTKLKNKFLNSLHSFLYNNTDSITKNFLSKFSRDFTLLLKSAFNSELEIF